MRNALSITLSALLSAATVNAEPRTFTNTEGKSIEAELVRVEGMDAILKLANNSTAKVAISSLSKSDEEFVKAWWEKNKDKLDPMEVSLTIDKNTERIDRKVTKSAPAGGGGNNTRLHLRNQRAALSGRFPDRRQGAGHEEIRDHRRRGLHPQCRRGGNIYLKSSSLNGIFQP